MSATNLIDVITRAANQIAAADLLVNVSYELAVEERFDHAPWRVLNVEVVEELSGAYAATLSLENDDPATDERELRGSSASLLIIRAGQGERRFSGIVQTVVSEGVAPNGTRRCRMILVPAFQCLDETVDWRKFLNMTVPDILREQLRAGLTPFGREAAFDLGRESATSPDPFAVREYTAQRGESVYQFVRRLCSEEGLTLWYDNSGPVEKLMVTDDNSRFARMTSPVRLLPVLGTGSNRTSESLRRFEVACNRMPTVATVNRFDLTRPMAPLLERAELAPRTNGAGPAGNGEVYDPTSAITLHQYQEDRYTGQDARFQARLRLQVAQAHGEVGSGEGDVIAFRPGVVFELTTGSGHPSPLEGEHLVTQVRHVGQAAARGDGGAGGASSYVNSFTTVPSSVPFRAPRIPRPLAIFDYAVVASQSDADPIHHDVHGRVKVKFWWDRTPGDPTSDDSGWIPVAVPWAGQGRGVQAVPRQGDVVVVSYDLGDPDRPVVTGSVNTGTNRLLFPLANKTVVALRTQSQRPDGNGGFGTQNFNELSMDDAAGAEMFSVRAGWNYRRTVLNDENTEISHDEYRNVGCNRAVTVCGNDDLTVNGSHTVSVGGDDALNVSGSRSVDVQGGESVSIGGSEQVTVTGPRTTTIVGPETVVLTNRSTAISGSDQTHVTANSALAVDGKLTITQGGTTVELAAGHVDINAASWVHVKHGGAEVTIDGGDNVTVSTDANVKVAAPAGNVTLNAMKIALEATTEVSMSVGANVIKADASGITINGAKIDATAGGDCHIVAGSIHLN